MKEYDDYSAKEQQQLAVCQRLISEKSYLSQEEIRRDLQNEGFEGISQSTVSRLLKLLGAIKIRNTKGQKIYSVNPQRRPSPDAGRSIAENIIANLSLSIRRQVMVAPSREFWITTHCRKFSASLPVAVLSGSHRGSFSARRWYTNKLIICLK